MNPPVPPRVRTGLRVFYVICAALALADLAGMRHGEVGFDDGWGFYPLYGFIACVVLVLAAKVLRKLIMRDESYYDPESSGDQDG